MRLTVRKRSRGKTVLCGNFPTVQFNNSIDKWCAVMFHTWIESVGKPLFLNIENTLACDKFLWLLHYVFRKKIQVRINLVELYWKALNDEWWKLSVNRFLNWRNKSHFATFLRSRHECLTIFLRVHDHKHCFTCKLFIQIYWSLYYNFD